MRALRATIALLLDPRMIGPEATTPWGGEASEASACDFVSEVLSQECRETVLDWRYQGAPHWTLVEVGDPGEYVEGSAFGAVADQIATQRVVVLNDGETYSDLSGCVILDLPDDIRVGDEVDEYVKENASSLGVPVGGGCWNCDLPDGRHAVGCPATRGFCA